MSLGNRRGLLTGSLALLTMCGTAALGAQSQPAGSEKVASNHRHDPVIIEARPIVTRFETQFARPRRVLLAENGVIFVADWAAGTVVRVLPNGKSEVIAEDLNEPAGLAQDSMGALYVSTHAAGMTKDGKIFKIADDGMKQLFAEGLTGPTGLAFDADDMLYVAGFHENSVVRVSPGGDVSTFAVNIPAPSDIVIDQNGALFVASSTEGTIYRISGMGKVAVFARGLHTPSDLAMDKHGHLIAANFGHGVVSHITKAGLVRTFAIVPKGTIAVEFDPRGNLVLANWDDRYLMRITTRIAIPCPHCDQKIPARLRTPSKPPAPEMPMESKPSAPPVI